MTEPFASGDWHVTEGKEEEFIQRWHAFLRWSREHHPSLLGASLLRDSEDAGHFISFAEWDDEGSRAAWKRSDGFAEHFGGLRALCGSMRGIDLERVVSV